MADVDLTTFDAMLRTLYPYKVSEAQIYEMCPAWAMLPKRTDFRGKNMSLPNWYGLPQGVSNLFASAQANKTAGSYANFLLTRANKYGVVSLNGETLEAAEEGDGASLAAMKAAVEGVLDQVSLALCIDLYGNGGGAIGQIGSISTDTITLKNIEDIVNFEVGMELESSETDGTSGALQSGTLTVTALDRDLGTITSDANITAQIATADADDYLFRVGDFGAALKGFEAWNPAAAPGATAFFGVDRSTDVTRLGGVRFVASTENIGTYEETLQACGARVQREGGFRRKGKIVVMMNPKDRYKLSAAMGSRARPERISVKVGRSNAVVGFNSIVLDDFPKPVHVVSDHNCPAGVPRWLHLGSWVLASLKGAPRLLERDGNKILRETDDDAYEGRVGARVQLGCHAPGSNARITLPTD